jgi:hypothetical protein
LVDAACHEISWLVLVVITMFDPESLFLPASMSSSPRIANCGNGSHKNIARDRTVPSGQIELLVVPNAFFVGCLVALLVDALLCVMVAVIL